MAQSIKLGSDTFLDWSGITVDGAGTTLATALGCFKLVEKGALATGVQSYTTTMTMPAQDWHTYLVFGREPSSATVSGTFCGVMGLQGTTLNMAWMVNPNNVSVSRNSNGTLTFTFNHGYGNVVYIYMVGD